MYQMIKELLGKGLRRGNIVYVDLEDYRLTNIMDYNIIEKVIHELFREVDGRIFLFLDEIQNLWGWDRWLRTLHNKRKYAIIVSGSSSKLLAKEVSTSLRGDT